MNFKKAIKDILKICAVSSLVFILIMFAAHYIPTGSYSKSSEREFYLSDNGAHVDIVLREDGVFKLYGWGSKVFFTEVDTFDSLTIGKLYKTLITDPSTLVRVQKTFYFDSFNWKTVKCSEKQYQIIKKHIDESHYNSEYAPNYYYGKDNYRWYYTCNTWVNNGLKKAGLKAPLYTLTSESITKFYN